MPLRSLASVLIALPCVLLMAGCESFSVVAVKRTPDASLLLPCVDPVLAPIGGSDNEVAAERLRVARAYLDCKARHAALAGWTVGQ